MMKYQFIVAPTFAVENLLPRVIAVRWQCAASDSVLEQRDGLSVGTQQIGDLDENVLFLMVFFCAFR